MKCTTGDLHSFDWGTHIHLMEEWNESSSFEWGEALVTRGFPYTIVVQPHTCDGEHGYMVAAYETEGEGDIVSLRVWDRQNTGDFNYVGKPPALKPN
jgi:hypothetical protein